MIDPTEPAQAFIDKWQARWPEWRIAQVFVPEVQQQTWFAWSALLQEWMDAACGGDEPAPGLAKLAWWQEELRGWSRGARRHPLGTVLMQSAVDWNALAPSMQALSQRDALLASATSARNAILPFARAVAIAESRLTDAVSRDVGIDVASACIAADLLTDQPIALGPESARALLQGCADIDSGHLPRARRIVHALCLARLKRQADGKAPVVPPPLVLWRAWGAARG